MTQEESAELSASAVKHLSLGNGYTSGCLVESDEKTDTTVMSL